MAEEFDSMAAVRQRAAELQAAREKQQEAQRERNPSYHQRQKETERGAENTWSGASMGGGVWAGRDRHR